MKTQVFAARCESCDRLHYPTHYYCPGCGGTEFSPVPIEGEGTLVTFTRAYALSLDYTQLFLTLGIVELDQGIRATGQIDCPQVKTGMRVRVETGPVRDIEGSEVGGLIFKKA